MFNITYAIVNYQPYIIFLDYALILYLVYLYYMLEYTKCENMSICPLIFLYPNRIPNSKLNKEQVLTERNV